MKARYKHIVLTTSLVVILLFIFAKSQAKAAQNNPIFATVDYVNNAISSALSPIQTSINTITGRVSHIEATVTPILGQIANLQNHQTQTDQAISSIQASTSALGNSVNTLQNAPSKAIW